MLGKTVKVVIDRPLGSCHPKYKDLLYTVNYGYVPGVMAPDGKEQDAYILGVDVPVAEYDAHIIAIVHRENDVEDKLVGAPAGMAFSKEEIAAAVRFQEQYYKTWIEMA